MSSAAVGTHSGAGPLSLMSCVRESSPLQDFDSDTEKNVASKRRFWNPRKWFKRRNKAAEDVIVVETSSTEIGKDALRSRSTSELSVAEETKRRSSGPMHPGLSVSHDSVFHSPNSGSDMELDAAQSSSSLSISQHHIDLRLQSELNERLRLRRGRGDTSEDDEGFPHSSCNSPTTSDGLLLDKTGIKDLPVKSHSTCSDGSLLSMGSSEMDEDSIAPQSRHSSKLSLYDKKSTTADSHFEFEPSASTTPLNHSAAHHRVAVKPKRTHGAPRRKRGQQLTSALPATPEVNEDPTVRSTSPEINRKETLTELYSMSATSRTTTLTETQLKCSSLPPGLTAPGAETSKLNRSKSNAGSKSQDEFEDDKGEKPSLFDRIFPRRSGRKKKSPKEEPEAEAPKQRSAPRPVPAPRSGPASRQRVQPCDIPATPDEIRREQPGAERDSCRDGGTSPLQAELENRFKQRQFTLSTSPPKPRSPLTPPRSPKSPKAVQNSTSVILSKSEYVHHQQSHTRTSTSTTHAQTRPRIAGLSSLQQRVLALNSDETDDAFKSLTEAQSVDPRPPVAKSFSFKSARRRDAKSSTEEFLDREREQSRVPFAKAASLDSVKNLEDAPRQPDAAKSEDSLLKLRTDENVELFRDSAITITGPSHTAVVNITTTTASKEDFAEASRNQTVETVEPDGSHKLSVKEHQVSVTKIQVKRESTEVSQSTVTVPRHAGVPEFFNKQLNKVETKPSTNIIFSMKSPKPTDESDHRPKTLFDFDITSKPPAPRRFSKENLEIIEKDQETSPKTPTLNRFKKHEPKSSRKSSVVSITPDSPVREIKNVFKSRSTSLDSLSSDKSSQDSLDKLEEESTKSKESPTVVLRKKSVVNKKSDEEPELMKVFARRSLKLKDNEIDAIQDNLLDVKTRDSDKENQIDSPTEDRMKWSNEAINNDFKRKEQSTKKEDVIIKEPLVENKTSPSDVVKNNKDSPPTLRRTFNSNIFAQQRAASLNPPKATPEFILRKQPSFQEHRKVDGWISKNEEEKIVDDRKSDFITEPKNFSQRKAEWEKRAQQAQRKTTP